MRVSTAVWGIGLASVLFQFFCGNRAVATVQTEEYRGDVGVLRRELSERISPTLLGLLDDPARKSIYSTVVTRNLRGASAEAGKVVSYSEHLWFVEFAAEDASDYVRIINRFCRGIGWKGGGRILFCAGAECGTENDLRGLPLAHHAGAMLSLGYADEGALRRAECRPTLSIYVANPHFSARAIDVPADVEVSLDSTGTDERQSDWRIMDELFQRHIARGGFGDVLQQTAGELLERRPLDPLMELDPEGLVPSKSIFKVSLPKAYSGTQILMPHDNPMFVGHPDSWAVEGIPFWMRCAKKKEHRWVVTERSLEIMELPKANATTNRSK